MIHSLFICMFYWQPPIPACLERDVCYTSSRHEQTETVFSNSRKMKSQQQVGKRAALSTSLHHLSRYQIEKETPSKEPYTPSRGRVHGVFKICSSGTKPPGFRENFTHDHPITIQTNRQGRRSKARQGYRKGLNSLHFSKYGVQLLCPTNL